MQPAVGSTSDWIKVISSLGEEVKPLWRKISPRGPIIFKILCLDQIGSKFPRHSRTQKQVLITYKGKESEKEYR